MKAKTRICNSVSVLLIFLLAISIVSAEDEEVGIIFNEWVEEGESVTINNEMFEVLSGVTDGTIILNSPTITLSLEKGRCIERSKIRYCLTDWKYKIGGTVKIHGEDTLLFELKIIEITANLELSKSIDKSSIQKGETAIVKIQITNIGKEVATNVVYEELLPPELMITNTNEIEHVGGNKLWWHGFVTPGQTKELTYSVQNQKAWSGTLSGILTYSVKGVEKQLTEKVGLKATGLIDIGREIDNPEINLGDETKVHITLKNKQNDKLKVNLRATFPDSLEVVASEFNKTDENVKFWNEMLEGGDEITFITLVKGIIPGKTKILITAETGSGMSYSKIAEEIEINIISEPAEIVFPKTEFNIGDEGTFKIFLRNPNKKAMLKKVTLDTNSTIFNGTSDIADWNTNQYDEIENFLVPTDKAGSYPFKAIVHYEIAGKEARAEKSAIIEVKEISVEPETPPDNGDIPESENTDNVPEDIPEEEKGFFTKIIDFFKGLFGKKTG